MKRSEAKNIYQIKLNVDRKTYEVYHNLNEKQRRRLKQLIKLIILSTIDPQMKELLDIHIVDEIDLSDNTKEFIKEVITESNEIYELAREFAALLVALNNMEEMSPGACEAIKLNEDHLFIIKKAKKFLSEEK